MAPAAARADVGDIIVQRAPGLTSAEHAQLNDDAGVAVVGALPIARTEVVQAAPGEQAEAVAALNADSDVVYAEPDRPVHVLTNDSYWSVLWGLSNDGSAGGTAGADISVLKAWALSRGAGVTVGVVDTGVNLSHADLQGQLIAGRDFVDGDDQPDDTYGHGTHVTGTIVALADNGQGIAGVAPLSKVVPLRALGSDGSGSMSTVAAAFAYAGKLGLRVVNASLGGGDSQTLRNAIAAYPNTLFVVAAGNDAVNDDDPSAAEYPCAYTMVNVLCVGASDRTDHPASFSNYGRNSVDLYAPGVNIASTYKTSSTSYVVMSGTSMATPHVAGAAALVAAANPTASTAQIKAALLSTADPVPALGGLSVTGGRLDAYRAVASIRGVKPEMMSAPASGPAPAPTPTPAPVPTAAPPVLAPRPVPVPPPAATPVPAPDRTAAPPVLRGLKARGERGKLRVTFSLSHAARVRLTARRAHAKPVSWSTRARSGANTLSRRLRRGRYTLSVALTANAARARFDVR